MQSENLLLQSCFTCMYACSRTDMRRTSLYTLCGSPGCTIMSHPNHANKRASKREINSVHPTPAGVTSAAISRQPLAGNPLHFYRDTNFFFILPIYFVLLHLHAYICMSYVYIYIYVYMCACYVCTDPYRFVRGYVYGTSCVGYFRHRCICTYMYMRMCVYLRYAIYTALQDWPGLINGPSMSSSSMNFGDHMCPQGFTHDMFISVCDH